MMPAEVFLETNFLFSAFRLPSKRNPNALRLKERLDQGTINVHVPYLCFQEAKNLISRNLPNNRCTDLVEFQRFAAGVGTATWDFNEVKKFLDAAVAEVNRTRAVYRRELADFSRTVDILQGTREVFDLLEAFDLDDESLKYNDKLILASVLVKASALKAAGAGRLYFASLDTSDLQPTSERPKLTKYYQDAGLTFLADFVLPEFSENSPDPPSQVPSVP